MTSKRAEHKPAAKYRLKFVPDAWREWQALDGSIKQALKPLPAKRQQNPNVPGAQLHRELADC
jgi:mRNA interferase RelE/StbE